MPCKAYKSPVEIKNNIFLYVMHTCKDTECFVEVLHYCKKIKFNIFAIACLGNRGSHYSMLLLNMMYFI